MLKRDIRLSRIDDVKRFVEAAMMRDYDIDLVSGKYVVNGKSIMGIFSLDLASPIHMEAHCDDDPVLLAAIQDFLV